VSFNIISFLVFCNKFVASASSYVYVVLELKVVFGVTEDIQSLVLLVQVFDTTVPNRLLLSSEELVTLGRWAVIWVTYIGNLLNLLFFDI
jgi:hypothetical protein